MNADLVVVGAGVAGLVVAHDAARAGLRVTVLEAATGAGGLLRRGALGGVDVDLGAESFATRTDAVAALAAELQLETCAPRPAGARLMIERDGRLVREPLPRRAVLGIPADPLADDVVRLIGGDAATRAADEVSLPVDAEPSLAELVAARCGAGLVAGLVDPLCRSVYSRPADAVRLSDVHPALWAAFLATGSLRAAAARVSTAARAGSAVAGIVGGMWLLPERLRAGAEAAGAEVRTGVAVRAVDAGRVRTDDGELRAERVVVATGPAAARALLGSPAAGTRPGVMPGTTPAAPSAGAQAVRVVSALVRSPGLDAHPVGSGVVSGVPRAAKALTHTTAKWAWAGDRVASLHGPGHHLVRLSAREPWTGLETPSDVAREIEALTGAACEVVDAVPAVWADAVPAVPLDAEPLDAAAARGIHVAGAAVAGTGLASVVPHARALTRILIQTLHEARSTV